jgi:hypothetical protein
VIALEVVGAKEHAHSRCHCGGSCHFIIDRSNIMIIRLKMEIINFLMLILRLRDNKILKLI